MNWDELPSKARETMRFIGDFSPTVNVEQKMVKGYMHDDEGGGKVYLDSNDLRTMADGFIAVADWLDKRAEGV